MTTDQVQMTTEQIKPFTNKYATFDDWYNYMLEVLRLRNYPISDDFKKWVYSKKKLCEDSNSYFFHPEMWRKCYNIQNTLKDDLDFVVVLCGRGGYGKSTLLLQMCAVISTENFNLQQISYNYNGFIRGWRTKKNGDSYALDEGALILNSMERGKKSTAMEKLSAIMRQYNLFVGICMTDFKLLKRHFRESKMNNLILFKEKGRLLYLNEEATDNYLDDLKTKGRINLKKYFIRGSYLDLPFKDAIPVVNDINKKEYLNHKHNNAKQYDDELDSLIDDEDSLIKGKLYTTGDVAKKLNISTRTIHKWIKDKKVKATKVGSRAFRIDEDEFNRLINNKLD